MAVAVCTALALPAAAAPAKPAKPAAAKATKAQGKRTPSNAAPAPTLYSQPASLVSTEAAPTRADNTQATSIGLGVPPVAAAPAAANTRPAVANAAFVGMPLVAGAAAHAPAPAPAYTPVVAPTPVAVAVSPRALPSYAPSRLSARIAAAAAASSAATAALPPETALAASPPIAAALPVAAAPQPATLAAAVVPRKPADAPLTGNPLADPVIRLLHARGLLPTQGDSQGDTLLTKVRDATSDLVTTAMNFIGVRYTWGGTSAKTGFDCSGFTRYVFDKSLGVALPRRSADQARSPDLQRIDPSNLKPGDLVFFNTLRSAFSHVGIYVGDGKFIHAPRTGSHVRVDSMDASYWAKRFNGARRAPQAKLDAAMLEVAARSPEAN